MKPNWAVTKMTDFSITRHASQRLAQRGFQTGDINLLLRLGEPVGRDGYRLSRSRAQREIANLKAEIQRLERLSGSVVVLCDDMVITVHHGENARSMRARRAR